MKVKITLAYDGSQFYGYQSQKDGTKTVANTLEDALVSLGIETKINASGRTDRGVHASGQVIDIDVPSHWEDLERLKNYLNRLCLPSIMIKDIKVVKHDFHARYSAKKRLYRYIVKVGEISVFGAPYLCYHDNLDVKKIESAIGLFEGEHDFAYFCKSGSDPKSTLREIYRCRFYRYKGYYIFTFEANGFLRSQIRMMMSFLLKISDGVLTQEDLKEQLSCKKLHVRSLAKPSGLYLAKIKY
jgi:tRNA pseudouridine38-40 synthase